METRSFWERSWKSLDRERLARYVERFDTAEDSLTRFLRERGARSVCDAGCGCGVYALKLARHGFSVAGFDLSADAAALAKALLAAQGFPARDFRSADILSTGYADGTFDAVVARDVLDHLPMKDAAAALAELLRIVRPGGCVLCTLDETDGDYEAEPHVVTADGDYRYTAGKWAGMVFHPYAPAELETLTRGYDARLLPIAGRGYLLALEKTVG